MSLINDALKKAQQARADQNLPPANVTPPTTPLHAPVSSTKPTSAPTNRPPPAAHPPIVWRDPKAPPQVPTKTSSVRYESGPVGKKNSLPIFWISLGAIAIIAISVRLTVMFMRPDAKPATTNKPATVAAPRAEPQVTATPPQVEVSLPAPTLAVQQAPSVPAPEPEPAPAVAFPTPPASSKPAETGTPAPEANPAVAAPAPTAAALPPIYAPRPPTPVNPSARVQSFLDRLRVSGVRMSGAESKVILNDRLLKTGDLVDPVLELRLIKIEQGVLTFTDANGKKYIKLFQ